MFLAPFIAPVFFPDSSSTVALIKFYGLKSTSFIVRPLGAIFFGHLARIIAIKNVLAITLLGVAICTFLIGIIPTYQDIGILAPLLLIIIRALQGFFAAGEHNIAAFLIIQLKSARTRGKSSGYYLCSTIAGSILASVAASIVSNTTNPQFYWRYAFILGLITAFAGIILRLVMITDSNLQYIQHECSDSIRQKTNKFKIFKIIIFSSFSYITYSIPFIFLNNFIPVVSNIKFKELLTHNTVLIIVNAALIPILGIIIDRFNHARWMSLMSFLIMITIIPIFYLLPHLTLFQTTLVKLWIVIIGVAFATPLYALLFKMIQGKDKYLITGFGYSIGTDIIGRNLTVICLALWHYSSQLWVPASYIALISLLTTILLLRENISKT